MYGGENFIWQCSILRGMGNRAVSAFQDPNSTEPGESTKDKRYSAATLVWWSPREGSKRSWACEHVNVKQCVSQSGSRSRPQGVELYSQVTVWAWSQALSSFKRCSCCIEELNLHPSQKATRLETSSPQVLRRPRQGATIYVCTLEPWRVRRAQNRNNYDGKEE